MQDATDNFQLPFLLPDQAQKHVTHNEALQRVDALMQLVIRATISTPPQSPVDGACYAISATPAPIWTGLAGQIALYQDGRWSFIAPKSGWIAYFQESGALCRFDGQSWQPVNPPDAQLQSLGINATADNTNRLALSSPASLFNHAGSGHQVKINRADDAATASLLFQSNWSGRAEMGLAGDNNFSIKASANGATWKTGLIMDGAGVVRLPQRPACRASLNPASASPAANSQTGFQVLSVNQGGFALGAALAPAPGNRLTVPATGLYMVQLSVLTGTTTGHSTTLLVNGNPTALSIKVNAQGANSLASAGLLLSLAANDQLSLLHSGGASLEFGPGKTELSLFML